jgi:hypothetical protein
MSPRRVTASALVAALLAAAIAVAGCGGSTRSNAGAFSWLRPAPSPAHWSLLRLGATVSLAYPRDWERVKSDSGTASAARVDPRSGLILQYLNVTPQQADETLQNWSTFRPAHNRDEGDSHLIVLAAARDLRFRDGLGSCVIDRYRTSRTSYQEIACLVRGPSGNSVVVAAALAARWAQSAPALERAVSTFLA